MRDAGSDPARPIFSSTDPTAIVAPATSTNGSRVRMTKSRVTRMITQRELEERPADTPWFVVHGEVYDGNPFLDMHPGGRDSIYLVHGQDATEDFMAIHSVDAQAQLAEVSSHRHPLMCPNFQPYCSSILVPSWALPSPRDGSKIPSASGPMSHFSIPGCGGPQFLTTLCG